MPPQPTQDWPGHKIVTQDLVLETKQSEERTVGLLSPKSDNRKGRRVSDIQTHFESDDLTPR